ncbi:MAG: hypothetical protein AAGU11_22580 [Syntrophobacteraceae bacterium]
MPEMMIQILERALATVKHLWGRFAGIDEYKLQESKVRIPDPRRVVYMNNQLRRSPSSGLDCRF